MLMVRLVQARFHRLSRAPLILWILLLAFAQAVSSADFRALQATETPCWDRFATWPLPSRLLVVPADAENLHWLTTLAAAQGLVNRTAPQGSMVWLDLIDCRYPPCSPHTEWLQYYANHAGVDLTTVADEDLLRWAKAEAGIAHYVIYDPEQAHGLNIDAGHTCTINLASTLAGIMGNALPVHPDNVARLESLGFTLLPDSSLALLGPGGGGLRQPRAFDLREQWTSLHPDSPWSTREQAYRWALDILLPLTDRRSVTLNNAFEARPTGQPGMAYEPWLNDYSVGARQFHFYFGPDPAPAQQLNQTDYDRELFGEMLSECGPLTMVRGWHADEYYYIGLLSEHRSFNGGMAWMPNLSVHAALSPRFTLDQKPTRVSPDAVHLDKDAVYLTFTFTDGDQAGVLYRNFWGSGGAGSLWSEPERGSVPIGWTMNALLYDLGRGIIDRFFREATAKDWFVADLPAGYAWFTSEHFADSLTDYLTMADCYISRAGLQEANFMPPGGVFSPVSGPTVASRVNQLAGVSAIREGYDGGSGYQGIYWPEDRPLLPYIRNTYAAGIGGYSGQGLTPDAVARKIEELTQAPTGQSARPLFLHMTWINWFTKPADIVACMELLQAHGDEYQLVRMDEFVELAKQAKLSCEYPLTFRPGLNGDSGEEAPYLWEDHGSTTNSKFDPPPRWRGTTGAPGENWVTYKFNVYPTRRACLEVELEGAGFRVDVSPDNGVWTTGLISGAGARQAQAVDVSQFVNSNGCFYVRFTGGAKLWKVAVVYGKRIPNVRIPHPRMERRVPGVEK